MVFFFFGRKIVIFNSRKMKMKSKIKFYFLLLVNTIDFLLKHINIIHVSSELACI